MNDLIIRKTKIEDFEIIDKQQKNSWFDTYKDEKNGIGQNEVQKAYDYAENPDKAVRKNKFIKDIKNNGFNVVVEVDDKIVGHMYGTKNDIKNQVWQIHVTKEHQGQGIGDKLMYEFLNWIDKDKPTYLGVISTNKKAIKYYEKHGFKITPNKLVDTLAGAFQVSEMVRPKDE